MDEDLEAKIRKVADAMRARVRAGQRVAVRRDHKNTRAAQRQRKQAGFANAFAESREAERKAAEFRARKAAA